MKWLEMDSIDAAERIDNPYEKFSDIRKSMSDVAVTNTLFGGTSAVLHPFKKLLRNWNKSTPCTVLDIGTGSADIPKALIQTGCRHGVEVTVTACDNQYKMLEIARGAIAHPIIDHIKLIQCDASSLPFIAGSFDFVTCSLLLHHIGFDRSVKLIADINRIAKHGFIISDLRRDKLSYLCVKSGMPLIGAHPITRHDGPLSVRRAFTFPEYRKMIALSGVNGIHLASHWYFRVAMYKE